MKISGKVFRTILSCALFLILVTPVWSLQPAIIGGLRDSLALGLMVEENTPNNFGFRFGVEATTGKRPMIVFLGGKFYLIQVDNRYPLSLGLGLVGYFGGRKSEGETAEVGGSVSLILDNPFDIKPLFFEAGIDVTNSSGKAQLQVGYRL